MSAKPYTSIVEAIEVLKKRGCTSNLEFLDQAFRNTGKIFKTDDLTIGKHDRFEGTSDPDHRFLVYAIESDAGPKGILADVFDVYANPALGRSVENVNIREEIEGSTRQSGLVSSCPRRCLATLISLYHFNMRACRQ